MIYKRPSPLHGHIQVTLELPSSIWADRIYLVGEFNNWNPRATPLHCARSGVWRVTLDLPAGRRYEFRYLIDGRWCTDQHADGCTSGKDHPVNSYVDTVLPQEAHPAETEEGAAHRILIADWPIRPRTPENGRARTQARVIPPVDVEEEQPVHV